MSLCIFCGSSTGEGLMCSYHTSGDDSWARSNKLMCDALHRGLWPERLTEVQRSEDYTSMIESGYDG